ncbi:unnamed protein product [Ilex paraguariensis]|uniref:Uncharacterized protein n=1 Tax=Ilex paraguariensis TaxID=185542 RepID=A0ABC8TWM3_9AQUA
MANSEKQQYEREIDELDGVDRYNGEGFDDSSSVVASSSGVETSATQNRGSGGEVSLTERLTDILVDNGDGDLLLQRSDQEDRVIQWLQALDLQFMGACRADERLKPLLKLNVSSDATEDRLVAHLSQYFEPSEVAMLARCLCIPLVSIRVGKIKKQGTLLCPTAERGNLILNLLPTSDLRISFVGDGGHTERLLTLSSDLQCPSVAVEGIPGDKSGRSFLIKVPDGHIFYFWCSEKSKLLGIDLLEKMKDLLERMPSLAELSGISESRLDCFAIHLRAYLVGSSVMNTQASTVISTIAFPNASLDSSERGQSALSSSALSKASRSRHYSNQGTKPNSLYQGSLSPRSSSFKEGQPRNLSSLRTVAREKYRRREDNQLTYIDSLSTSSLSTAGASISNHLDEDKLPGATGNCLFPPSSFLESLGKLSDPPFPSLESRAPSTGSPFFSPYYCWCPPVSPSLQYTVACSQPPISLTESLSLPPLSSLLPVPRSSSLLAPKLPFNLAEVPSLDFPPFLPEPLGRLPLSMSSSQQIPTFTPLMCDSIVHVPFIDVCSSGQGYLVSAGPAISTAIPPLHPNLVNPLIPETESVVEKGARETLRLLISSSSQANPQLLDVLPSVLTHIDEKGSMLAAGSRGLYTGTTDVAAFANSIAAMGLVSLSERSDTGGLMKTCFSRSDLVDQLEKSGGSDGACSDDDDKVEGGKD